MRVPQSTVSEATPKLGAALRQRHVTMIALGLAVASAAYLLLTKRVTDEGTATGYLSPIGEQAMEGRK